jgi:ligand-binding sensor domain-containing protein
VRALDDNQRSGGQHPGALQDWRMAPGRLRDRSGMLWFGTDTHGLFRLDPTTQQLEQFKNDPSVKDSLSTNAIMDIYQDSRGVIWVATFGGGLNRYVPEENAFEHYRQGQGLPNDVVYGILEDDGGRLWLSTNLGLSRFDAEADAFENFTVQDGLQSNEFNSGSFAKDAEGRMYFGGVRIDRLDPTSIERNGYVPGGADIVDVERPPLATRKRRKAQS